MTDHAPPNEISLDDALAMALTELAEAVKPGMAASQQLTSFHYLLWLWGSFTVYQTQPFAWGGGDEEEGGDEGGTGTKGPTIITMDNGRTIIDHGHYLTTSTGSDLASFATGKLLECADKMIEILAERGATHVNVLGHPAAVRKAWMKCLDLDIEVSNFAPTLEDWQLRSRIRELRKQVEQTKKRVKDLLTKYRR